MKTKKCHVCGTENLPNVLACTLCGSAFTLNISQETRVLAYANSPIDLTGLPPNTILFFFMSNREPITITGVEKIILGRTSNRLESPTIDLEALGGQQLGVSRHHAVIEAAPKGYELRDLESANGTWLNGLRLLSNHPYPLQSGDNIRLAKMPCTVYFQLPVLPKSKFYVLNDSLGGGLSPNHLNSIALATKILNEIETSLNIATGKPIENLSIEQIESQPSEIGISVLLSGKMASLPHIIAILGEMKNQAELTDLQQKTDYLVSQLSKRMSLEPAQLQTESALTLKLNCRKLLEMPIILSLESAPVVI